MLSLAATSRLLKILRRGVRAPGVQQEIKLKEAALCVGFDGWKPVPEKRTENSK
jgi:hypothetical protein